MFKPALNAIGKSDCDAGADRSARLQRLPRPRWPAVRQSLVALLAAAFLVSQTLVAQHVHADAEVPPECAACVQADHTPLPKTVPEPLIFVALDVATTASSLTHRPRSMRIFGYQTRAPPQA